MDFYGTIEVLIEYPFLALGPAAVLFFLFLVSKNRFILITAITWFAYLPYEYAMKFRILCSGECNIRIDLLLIYPVLIIASLVSMVLAFRRRKNI